MVEWRIRDAAFLSITEGIQDMVEDLRGFLSFPHSDNFGRLEKIKRQLEEFYRPIYVRRQRDARNWILIMGLKQPEESVDYKLAEVIERDFVLPNHEEIIGIIDRSRHLVEGDAEMCEVLDQYLQHVTAYKDLRASGDKTRFPFEVNAPFPLMFDGLIEVRIKSLEREEAKLASTQPSA